MPAGQLCHLHSTYRRKHAPLHLRWYALIRFTHQVGSRNVAPRGILQWVFESIEARVSHLWNPVIRDLLGGIVEESSNWISDSYLTILFLEVG